MRRLAQMFLLMVVVLSMTLSTGCSIFRKKGSTGMEGVGIDSSGQTTADTIGDGQRRQVADMDNSVFKTIYFDFDRSEIRSDQAERMNSNAQYLKDNPGVTVLIEGHCDERGTNEYNFALGERRARSVRDFLISRGVKAENISIISKGEEEPAMIGTGEDVWALNRRAEFRMTR